MSEQVTCHISVLLAESVEAVGASAGGRFLDCTLGGAGHTQALLDASADSSVVAIDRDLRAIGRAQKRLAPYEGRVVLHHAAFSKLPSLVGKAPFESRSFHGMLADLGVSTDQIREGRGFSFHDGASLDMRMNEDEGSTAEDLVNTASEQELFIILKEGGVGFEARAIARAIVAKRPFHSAAELSKVINQLPHKKGQTNPSTLAFQALRMAVNRELEEIDALLQAAPRLVRQGGKLAVITFHSLEDKAVARTMRAWEGEKEPALWPGAKATKSLGRVVSKKAITPSDEELQTNPSARSARLRVFQFE